MEIATIVLIVLNCIFALFVLCGFLWGLKRGLKKSALRIGFIAGCLLIAFFVAMPVTNSLINMDISSMFTYTDSNGDVHKTLNDIISSAIADISPDVKDAYDHSPSLQALIDALPQMILQSLIFVILFWLLKLLTWPIFAVIAKCLWGKKKNKEEAKAQEGKPQPKTVQSGRVVENGNTRPTPPKKENKHRWSGAAVGTLQGLMIAFFTLIPIAGFSSIIYDIDHQATTEVVAESPDTNDNELQPLGQMLRESLGDDIVNALTAYESSALGVICGWTDIDGVAFDIQTSAKVNGKTTNLRKEVNAISCAYAEASKIKSFDLSTMDFDTVQQLFDYLVSSPSVSSIADELIPYYIEKVINESTINPTIKELMTMYIDAYNTPTIAELKDDISHICTALKIIQSNDVFAYMENANPFDIDEFIKIIEADDTKNPLRDIFAEVTKSTTTQKIFQTFINYGLKTLGDEVSTATGKNILVKTVTFDNVNWNAVSNEVPTILNKAITLYQDFKAVDNNDATKLLNVNFKSVGEILDLFASSTLLEDAFDSAMDILEQYDDYSKYFSFATLKNNVNFTQEFTYVQNVIDALDSVGALYYFDEASAMTVTEMIKKLDSNIPETTNNCIDVVFNNLTSSTILKASLPKTLNTIYPDLLKDLSTDIKPISTSYINWETENATLKQIAHFVASNIDTFTDGATAKTILNEVDLASVGQHLDAIKESCLLFPALDAGINYAKTNADFKEYLNPEAISIDLNFTNEFDALSKAINVAKDSGIMDTVLAGGDQMTQDILDILKANENIATNLIDNLFNSSIMQQSIELLINKLQNLMGDALKITIEKTTVDADDFVAHLTTKKAEFANILNSIAKIGSPILDSEFTLDVFADNIDNFTNAFVALQSSTEFKNTYNAILDYLATNEQINDVIDFAVIGNNFDYVTEFGKLKEIINILKANNIWSPLVAGTSTIEDLVDTLDAETKETLIQHILESKLFVGYATKALNNMIDEFNTYLGTTVAHIAEGTDLSSQSENIAKITRYLSDIDTSTNIDLKTIDKENLGNLLNELKKNKFDFTPSGALSAVYEAFVDYMIDDNNSDYGYIILDACDAFATTSTTPKNNASVDWVQITGAFDELLDVYDNLETIGELTADDTITIFNTIGTSTNTLVERLVKTYLKHNETDPSKINAINNFNFKDTQFNSDAIGTLYDLKDISDTISTTNTSEALTQIDAVLAELEAYNTTKLDALVAFIDAVTDKNIASYTSGVNFTTERTTVSKLKELLDYNGTYSFDLLDTAIDGIKDSTLILAKLAENNVVICDISSESVMEDLKDELGGIATDAQVLEGVRTAIAEKVSDTTKQEQIANILGISMA